MIYLGDMAAAIAVAAWTAFVCIVLSWTPISQYRQHKRERHGSPTDVRN